MTVQKRPEGKIQRLPRTVMEAPKKQKKRIQKLLIQLLECRMKEEVKAIEIESF
jgi:hypothetical protein